MDRFERGEPEPYLPDFSVHLHSNMDRFESSLIKRGRISHVNLHSNMDRFERPYFVGKDVAEVLFTFQYG